MRPDQVLTVAQMRSAEQALIDGGETVGSLMQTAGQGAAGWVWRVAAGRPVTVLCGPGNNGGDGYVIAETLRARGLDVAVVAPLDPATEAAREARAAFRGETGGGGTGGVFVDCLFGSGLTRPLGELAPLVRSLAGSHRHAVAVDLPSGVESDSGALLDEDLPRYDLTLALGAWKFAHWTMPAMERMGERRLVPIGVGAVEGAAQLLQRPHLAAPARDAHKYTRGLVLVVGGVMSGASRTAPAPARSSSGPGSGATARRGRRWPRPSPPTGRPSPTPTRSISSIPARSTTIRRRWSSPRTRASWRGWRRPSRSPRKASLRKPGRWRREPGRSSSRKARTR